MNYLIDNPWNVQPSQFPERGTDDEKLMFLLNYAVLAPSAYNTQPWLFRLSAGEVELYADRSRALPVVDPEDRQLIMSCGAVLFHLITAARNFGYQPLVKTFPLIGEPDLMAYLRLGKAYTSTPDDKKCFAAIKKRRTNRKPFNGKEVPVSEVQRLVQAAREEGVGIHVFTAQEEKQELGTLIAEGKHLQSADTHFQRELAAWVHPNRNKSRDGFPGYANAEGDTLSNVQPRRVRSVTGEPRKVSRDQQLAEESPVLLVLSTRVDSPVAWLYAGQALDRVLLLAASSGLQVAYFNQPIEVPRLRSQVSRLVGGRYSQLILGLGYGRPAKLTPRRPVHEVLTSRT